MALFSIEIEKGAYAKKTNFCYGKSVQRTEEIYRLTNPATICFNSNGSTALLEINPQTHQIKSNSPLYFIDGIEKNDGKGLTPIFGKGLWGIKMDEGGYKEFHIEGAWEPIGTREHILVYMFTKRTVSFLGKTIYRNYQENF